MHSGNRIRFSRLARHPHDPSFLLVPGDRAEFVFEADDDSPPVNTQSQALVTALEPAMTTAPHPLPMPSLFQATISTSTQSSPAISTPVIAVPITSSKGVPPAVSTYTSPSSTSTVIITESDPVVPILSISTLPDLSPDPSATNNTSVIVAPATTLSADAFTATSNSSVFLSTTAVVAPATTVMAAPIVPQDNLAHSPPFYVGIVFGTIAFIAIVAAFVAWGIRIRSRRKRKLSATQVPWAFPDPNGHSGLESGRGENSELNDTISAMNLGSREDLAHVQAWEPRGDRDAGEPKRTESYLNSARAATSAPIHDFYTSSYPAQPPPVLSDRNPTGLYGTPRETAHLPRFLALDGGGLDVPWRSTPATPSIGERLKRLSRRDTVQWKDLPGTPQASSMEKGTGVTTNVQENDADSWTASLRSNLMNAFNAVAANLTAVGGVEDTVDNFTPMPEKHWQNTRKSICDTDWRHGQSGSQSLKRGNSGSSAISTAWTLEETGDGMGVVHIRVNDLDHSHSENDVGLAQGLNPSMISFDDGSSMLTGTDHGTDMLRKDTHESQIPLIAKTKPQPAYLRPFSSNRGIESGTVRGTSSAESQRSHSPEYLIGFSRIPQLRRRSTKNISPPDGEDSATRPKFETQSSSCSITSSPASESSISSLDSEINVKAKKALEARRVPGVNV